MPIPLKLIIGPSSHYHQLKSGPIKYQKSKPSSPIWRILLIDEENNRMQLRVFSSQPSADAIDKVVIGMLSSENLLSHGIVIPKTVEKLCPGLQKKLMANDVDVYLPAHGFASGALAIKEADKFLRQLGSLLHMAGENMASCEEITANAGNPLGLVKVGLWLDENKGLKFELTYKMADEITRLRGHDPEIGRKNFSKKFFGLIDDDNHILPAEEALSTLLSDPIRFLGKPGVRDIIFLLEKIMDTESGQKLPLMQELGWLAVSYQINSSRNGSYDFLSNLSFAIGKSLYYLVLLGIKEAFKMFIVINEGLLQVLAAKVTVHYPKDCADLSLRGIPAHHRLEQMVQQIAGGKVAIPPEFTSFTLRDLGFPSKLREIWVPFNFSYQFSTRTPLNPAQCLIPISKAGSQKNEGFLFVLAILPRDTKTSVPIGDQSLANRMTSLVNERLARNGKGVTCQIGPLQMYGDLMEIGDPPQN